MSFGIALSGIAAAQKDLDTTANNIANVSTTGFKESRAEFSNVYASSIFSSGKTKVGDGVATAQVAQQFHQGALRFTNNSLDLAITGDGFYAMTPDLASRDMTFTRAGAFKLNKDNFVVDSQGNFLQGFQTDPATGATTSVSLSTTKAIQIPDSAGAPRSTTNVFLSMNLDSRATIPVVAAFDPTDIASYSSSTSTTIYDSLGEAHVMGIFFVKVVAPPDRTWNVHLTIDGQDVSAQLGANVGGGVAGAPATTISFTADGQPATNPLLPVAITGGAGTTGISGILTNGATFPTTMNVNWRDSSGTRQPTQYASKFEVNNLEQDGATVGRLTGIDINAGGKVVASYSNGDSSFLGQIAIARFGNVQGLRQVGNTAWKKSLDSGEPLAGEANTGTYGSINSSALEVSNVNLTNELVDLIAAQRNFQANSRALEVNSTLQQTVLQIR
ncbi:MAG: flagellar hook protein FlgE [Algicola sp.]|nr:flagellar hook protein FlgE [Algicola sp.]